MDRSVIHQFCSFVRFGMHVFAFPKDYNQHENTEKPTVASFQLTARNLKLLYFADSCTPGRVHRCFTNFHLEDK